MRRLLPLLGLSLLAIARPAQAEKRPGILATLGPGSGQVATLRAMLREGMGLARINLSHGNARTNRALVQNLAQAATLEGRGQVPLLFDLPGGKVRLGRLSEPGLSLAVGQPFEVTFGREQPTTRFRAGVGYRALADHVREGDRIFLDDDKIALRVTQVATGGIQTVVERGGTLRSHLGLTVEGKELPFPSMTAEDRRKLRIAVQNGASYVGVSFVQSVKNLEAVRRALGRLGAPQVKVVAKIETLSALAQLDAIVAASDAVMIARGDLAQAVGREHLPAAQARIAARCRAQGKPFIAATNFLSQMIEAPVPSAANLADVERAERQRPWLFMLNETAIGKYPVETVRTLREALGR
ncbi:MAG: hypothetical protein IT371_17070 [Deltaproteobacteria bacterium]|nr:hypothetical protein [Deltaproteobacteria bacterium]